MTEQEWMQEGMDFRLFFLRFIRKIWIVAIGALAGALLFGGGYFIRHVVYAPARQYEALSRYYITFTDDMGKDYYNDYTWNDLAASDPILDYTMSLLPAGYDKDEVRQSVEAKIFSDVRVLSTTVTTNNPDKTLAVALATEQSICHFGELMPEIAGIEVILDAEVSPVIVDVYTARAVLIGLLAGLLAGVFAVVFWLILDDSVYLEKEAAARFGIAVLGGFYQGELDHRPEQTAGGSSLHIREMAENTAYLAAGEQRLVPLTEREEQAAETAAAWMETEAGSIKATRSCLEWPEQYKNLRPADGVILLVRCGAHNGCLVEKEIGQMRKQGCHISGLVLYDMDQKLNKYYYFGTRWGRTPKGNQA